VAVDGESWVDTYRGTVFPWETDIVEHLTVAYYFERFADATVSLLDGLGLGADYMRAERHGCVTADCFVRYTHELRVGDILHISSAVIGVEPQGLRLGHRVFNSDTGVLCATMEQRTVHRELRTRAATPLPPSQRRAAESRQAAWDGPARETRWQPESSVGFLDYARDTVKPWEIDVFGQSAFPFYIHRFSAAGIQAFAQFGMTPAYMREQRRGMSTFEFQLEFLGELPPAIRPREDRLAPPGQLVDPRLPPDAQRAHGRGRGLPRPVRRAPGRRGAAADADPRLAPGASASDPDPPQGVTHDRADLRDA
jgi:acyl-CoA thioesterase FadM